MVLNDQITSTIHYAFITIFLGQSNGEKLHCVSEIWKSLKCEVSDVNQTCGGVTLIVKNQR